MKGLRARWLVVVFLGACSLAQADPAAVQRLVDDSAGSAEVGLHPATGVARFVKLAPGSLQLAGAAPAERAAEFLRRHGRAFGITDPPSELSAATVFTDRYGHVHLGYDQIYRGLPVFATRLRVHFDATGQLVAANGTFLPGIAVNPHPNLEPADAEAVALGHVRRTTGAATALEAESAGPMVFRAGLVRGVPGRDHLVFEIEVSDGRNVRKQVYVDAHTGKIVDEIEGVHTITRRVHQPDFDDVVIWNEGDSLPYDTGDPPNDSQVNGLIAHAATSYSLFSNLSGGTFLSWDGAGGIQHSIWQASFLSCPNASWNGTSTNYCDGVTSDDVACHEWTHAYTQSTHGLIYQWQPGALNEAYSDIFGETSDMINGTGQDAPAPLRTVGDCSTFGGTPPPTGVINSPPSIAGAYTVAGASFNPAPPQSATGNVQWVNDANDEGGTASVRDGCQALVGFTPGRIALIDRGTCSFVSKATNARNAGAAAVMIVNSDDSVFSMSGSGTLTIPSVMIASSAGDQIKAQLGGGVNGTVALQASTANSLRWLMGEDSFGFGEPIRDMWNPTCKADPGKVSDAQYVCTSGDNGGVHSNSGVPNHGFALLVDGGTYNGHMVQALGLTRAAHLYWRAMQVYQVPDTGFADHADALAQSCTDLLGINLANLTTGAPSGQSLNASHCNAVNQAMLALEMAAAPGCNFQPLLDPAAPPVDCGTQVFHEDFESDPTAGWSLSNSGVFAEYVPRDWVWTSSVPPGGSGAAFFALDDIELGNCIEGNDDQSGVMRAGTPPILLPSAAPVLSFDHYVATEPGYDGGNVKISVNAGAFQLIPSTDFSFNPYNVALVAADDGNTNPMAGEEAFTGANGGSVTGSWGESQVDVSPWAGPGDTVRLRFDLGVDGCNGLEGWYVDNVTVCTAPSTAGRVPGTGTPLAVTKAGGDITLTWGASCLAGDDDYEVYEGDLGDFTSHAPRFCTTGGATSQTLEPGPGSTYYLVTPRNLSREGSYGTDSEGFERPVSGAACLVQDASGACP